MGRGDGQNLVDAFLGVAGAWIEGCDRHRVCTDVKREIVEVLR